MKTPYVLLIVISTMLILCVCGSIVIKTHTPKVHHSRLQITHKQHNQVLQKVLMASVLEPLSETEIVIISMEIDTKRINNINSQLPSGVYCSVLRAVDGSEFRHYFQNLIQWKNTCSKKITRNCGSDGEIGCAFSHIVLWYYLLISFNKKYLVILEDDATIVTKHFIQKISKMVQALPSNWNQVLLGYNSSANTPNEVPELLYDHSHGIYEIPLNVQKTGAYGYMVSRQGAEALLNYYLPLKKPIDNTIGVPNRYLAVPPLITHEYLFPSNLNNILSFKVVVTTHNAGQRYLKKCFDSILEQKEYCDVCIVDDGSKTPETALIQSYCSQYGWKSVFLKQNHGALYARIVGMHEICNSNNDVVLLLDGDDALVPRVVFNELRHMYGSTVNPVVTYGRYQKIDVTGTVLYESPHDDQNYINTVADKNIWRSTTYRFSHLKTFRYGLFKQINVLDLQDENGEYFKAATDVAIMMPLLEMAGRRVQCSKRVLYLYTADHPLSLHMNKKTKTQQQLNHEIIRRRHKYVALDDDVLENVIKKQIHDLLHIDDHFKILRQMMIETKTFPSRISFNIKSQQKFTDLVTVSDTLCEIGFYSAHAAIIALTNNPSIIVTCFNDAQTTLSAKCKDHLQKYYPQRWVYNVLKPPTTLSYDVVLINTGFENSTFEFEKCKHVICMKHNEEIEKQCKQKLITYASFE